MFNKKIKVDLAFQQTLAIDDRNRQAYVGDESLDFRIVPESGSSATLKRRTLPALVIYTLSTGAA